MKETHGTKLTYENKKKTWLKHETIKDNKITFFYKSLNIANMFRVSYHLYTF